MHVADLGWVYGDPTRYALDGHGNFVTSRAGLENLFVDARQRGIPNTSPGDLNRLVLSAPLASLGDALKIFFAGNRVVVNPTSNKDSTMAIKLGEPPQATSMDDGVKQMLALVEALLKLRATIDDAAQKRAAARLELLSKNREHIDWLLDSLSDLRKERMNFEKKSLPEIASALKDGAVPPQIAEGWLTDISSLYHQDISAAQRLLALDTPTDGEAAYDSLRRDLDERLKVLTQQLLGHVGAQATAPAAQGSDG